MEKVIENNPQETKNRIQKILNKAENTELLGLAAFGLGSLGTIFTILGGYLPGIQVSMSATSLGLAAISYGRLKKNKAIDTLRPIEVKENPTQLSQKIFENTKTRTDRLLANQSATGEAYDENDGSLTIEMNLNEQIYKTNVMEQALPLAKHPDKKKTIARLMSIAEKGWRKSGIGEMVMAGGFTLGTAAFLDSPAVAIAGIGMFGVAIYNRIKQHYKNKHARRALNIMNNMSQQYNDQER